ncbi:MAG: amino acid adenylation domain-containing protein, partial [Proteobacteria bacterium]|nr:amino acid adenylation domain-containing protein [Pseudomonadota bacterium]
AISSTIISFVQRSIRKAAKERLPFYMLPGQYIQVKQMPLLPNGKIDRKQLPHPQDTKAIEQLNHQSVPATPKQDVETPKQSPLPSDFIPVTPSQARMLFIEEMNPDTTVHNLIGAWTISGNLDFKAFARALEVLVIEQESLRMAAVRSSNDYVLQCAPPFAPELKIYGRDKPNANLDEVRRLIAELSRKKLDITQVPNFRMGLYPLGSQKTVFFLMTHHILWDGFSYGVMWKNLQRLYQQALQGISPSPELPAFNFSQYAKHRQLELLQQNMQDELSYWQTIYNSIPEPLELAYDYPRPAELNHAAATAWVAWDKSIDHNLQKFSQSQSCTVFHVLLSAYYVLLYRLSGHQDLVVGTPVHGRNQIEVFDLIGNFINVVALRQTIDKTENFITLLANVKRMTTDAMAHSDLPFENLVAALKLPRDAGRTPLYNTMFFFQDLSLQKTQLGDALVEGLRLPNITVDTDLVFWVERYAQETFAGFNYRTDLWDQGSVDGMAQAYRCVLEDLLLHPDRSLKDTALLTSSQKATQIEAFHRPKESHVTLLDLILQQAIKNPTAPSVIELSGQSMSWQELEQRSLNLAISLQKRGIKRGDIIGISLARQLDLVVALLATLRCGAAYLPLDPNYPSDRIQFMIEDSGARLILTETVWLSLFASSSVPCLWLDRDRTLFHASNSKLEQGSSPSPMDLAYIIYTSGSTGQPKAVEIQHKAVVTFLEAFRTTVPLAEPLRTLAITTISFDISVLEIFGTLVWGGTLVLATYEDSLDASTLIKALSEQKINLLQATPATYRLLLSSRWFGNPDLITLCGGEALTRDLARELIPRCKSLWNVYGPTEATVWALAAPITDADAPITIGRPLPFYECFILDENLSLLPLGAIGSLYLGGPALALSYRNRPELTQERFISHPFQAGERIYDTGDLCRFRSDGRVEYISRKDNQIKLRGFRIELGEIEAAIAKHPSVKQAVVIVREDDVGDRRLVAYCSLKEGASLDLPLLSQFLRSSLPTYMLPNHLVTLEQFKLTGSGKIDKKALPKPATEADKPKNSPSLTLEAQVLNEAERSLAQIFCEMIGINTVQKHDNFFDLGGHSILALKVLLRCQEELGVQFKIRDLLMLNLAQLAKQIPTVQRNKGGAS